eukprot:TRINITY_DN20522_c0_g1_i1.p1 TRINITY_DN20522_c0_g1~~TRINITY_DN20522_c0_g1_i1.p1  ORF type:complete len:275 (+),score=60.75 TRINITY_DN20522_c0_g1_i1:341-1165(+)
MLRKGSKGMEMKNVGMVMVKMDSFDEFIDVKKGQQRMVEVAELFCDIVADNIHARKGVISDLNLGNGIIIGAWNRRTGVGELAAECALAISNDNRIAKLPHQLLVACHAKNVFTGNLGGKTTCAPSTTGFFGEILDVLVLVARYQKAKVVTGCGETLLRFEKVPLNVIIRDKEITNIAHQKYCRKVAKYKVLIVHELLGLKRVEEEEWMYQYESLEEKEANGVTRAFQHFIKGEFATAADILEDDRTPHARRLLAACEDKIVWDDCLPDAIRTL